MPMKMEPAKSFESDPVQPLRKLSYALRHPETWPPEFEFDFHLTDKCALGLACELRMIKYHTVALARPFGLSFKEAWQLFFASDGKGVITAAMVADSIDAYLARQAA
jgi:hypothetical protein